MPLNLDAIDREAYERGRADALEEAAQMAENYSNAKPGDICEVMAGDWQAGIAKAIRGLGQ